MSAREEWLNRYTRTSAKLFGNSDGRHEKLYSGQYISTHARFLCDSKAFFLNSTFSWPFWRHSCQSKTLQSAEKMKWNVQNTHKYSKTLKNKPNTVARPWFLARSLRLDTGKEQYCNKKVASIKWPLLAFTACLNCCAIHTKASRWTLTPDRCSYARFFSLLSLCLCMQSLRWICSVVDVIQHTSDFADSYTFLRGLSVFRLYVTLVPLFKTFDGFTGCAKNDPTCFVRTSSNLHQNLIIFGTQIAKEIEICKFQSVSTSHSLSMYYRVKRRCSKLLHK